METQSTDQLYALKAKLKAAIRTLEKKGALRTAGDNAQLKACRAQMRQTVRELSKRAFQTRMF